MNELASGTLNELRPSIVQKVVVSSTVRDLEVHRKTLIDACLRLDMFPKVMEYLPAADLGALEVSLGLIDDADIFIGVYAYRYGTIIPGDTRSIIEHEYDRAVATNVPRFIFLIDSSHSVTIDDIDKGLAADKLAAFKVRVREERVVATFTNADHLRAQVIDSLRHHRALERSTHYLRTLNAPPEPYVAHPYTLLNTGELVGRLDELEELNRWVDQRERFNAARLMCVVGIGGMGKSALTWTWFSQKLPLRWPELGGRFWWSFYESDATFENFVSRCLAYVKNWDLDYVSQMTIMDREHALIEALTKRPYLIALDGIERILNAYAQPDSITTQDENIAQQEREEQAAQRSVSIHPPQDLHLVTQQISRVERPSFRKTIDPAAGSFLRKLSTVQASRIVISSRLFPAELETAVGNPIPAVNRLDLTGLRTKDAIELWNLYGVSGQPKRLKELFDSFDNYPLLIKALAGEIAQYRPAPGDLNVWLADHPSFDPFSLPLSERKTHVLDHSFKGLKRQSRTILWMIAGFRMPTTYSAILDLLVGQDSPIQTREPTRFCPSRSGRTVTTRLG